MNYFGCCTLEDPPFPIAQHVSSQELFYSERLVLNDGGVFKFHPRRNLNLTPSNIYIFSIIEFFLTDELIATNE